MKYRICAEIETVSGNKECRQFFLYARSLSAAKREVNKIADVYFGEAVTN